MKNLRRIIELAEELKTELVESKRENRDPEFSEADRREIVWEAFSVLALRLVQSLEIGDDARREELNSLLRQFEDEIGEQEEARQKEAPSLRRNLKKMNCKVICWEDLDDGEILQYGVSALVKSTKTGTYYYIHRGDAGGGLASVGRYRKIFDDKVGDAIEYAQEKNWEMVKDECVDWYGTSPCDYRDDFEFKAWDKL